MIGVYRIHATHQEGTREDEDEVKDPEVDWNHSALTITVNPMEVMWDLFTFVSILVICWMMCIMWTELTKEDIHFL